MSTADKFNHVGVTGNVSLTNGTSPFFGASLGAVNLDTNQPIKTNSLRQLVSSKLAISDVNGLQTALDSTLTDPFVGTLTVSDLETDNYFSLETELQKIDNFTASTQSPDVTTITGMLLVDEVLTDRIQDKTSATFIDFDTGSISVNATNFTFNGVDVATGGSVGSGKQELYLNKSIASDIGGYFELGTELTGTGEVLTAYTLDALEGVPKLLDIFITSLDFPGVDAIPQGLSEITLYGSVLAPAGNTTISYEIYKRNLAGTETLIFSSDESSDINSTDTLDPTRVALSLAITNTPILVTDRIVLKLYGTKTTPSDKTLSVNYEGNSYYTSWVSTFTGLEGYVRAPTAPVTDETVSVFDGTTGRQVKSTPVTLSSTGTFDNVEAVLIGTDANLVTAGLVVSGVTEAISGFENYNSYCSNKIQPAGSVGLFFNNFNQTTIAPTGDITGSISDIITQSVLNTAQTVNSVTGVNSSVLASVAGSIITDAIGVSSGITTLNATSQITNGTSVAADVYNTGTMTNYKGVNVSVANTGTITNTYGVYVGDLTSGTQTNQPWGVYQSDTNSRNYFGGEVQIANPIGSETYTYQMIYDVINSPMTVPGQVSTSVDGTGMQITASVSSLYSGVTATACYKLFNGNAADYAHTGNTLYNSVTGLYEGSETTVISGVSYLGEWFQAQYGISVEMDRYVIYPRNIGTVSHSNPPGSYVIGGSNDGITWTLIDSKTHTHAEWDAFKLVGKSVDIVPIQSFAFYRLVLLNRVADDAEATFISLGEWEMYSRVPQNGGCVISTSGIGVGLVTPETPLHTLGIGTFGFHEDSSGSSVLIGKKSRGTYLAPTVIEEGDLLVGMRGVGHNGTTYANGGHIGIYTGENWSGTANGSYAQIDVVSNTTTDVISYKFGDDQVEVPTSVKIGSGAYAEVSALAVVGTNPLVSGNIRNVTQALTHQPLTASTTDVRNLYNITTLAGSQTIATATNTWNEILNNTTAVVAAVSCTETTVTHNSVSTITDAVGIKVKINNSATGTITNPKGILIDSPSNTSGTLSYPKGLQINEQYIGTTTQSYGIFCDTPLSRNMFRGIQNYFSDGTAAAPAIAFDTSIGTGVYLSGTTLGVSTSGTTALTINNTQNISVPGLVHAGYASDAAAATGAIPIGGLYVSSAGHALGVAGVLCVRQA